MKHMVVTNFTSSRNIWHLAKACPEEIEKIWSLRGTPIESGAAFISGELIEMVLSTREISEAKKALIIDG